MLYEKKHSLDSFIENSMLQEYTTQNQKNYTTHLHSLQ